MSIFRGEESLRKNIVDFKKDRRIALGPYATFYFESYRDYAGTSTGNALY
jgi:hypothetical protein